MRWPGRPNDVQIPADVYPELDRLSDRPVGNDQCATAGRLRLGQFEPGQRGVAGEEPLAAAADHHRADHQGELVQQPRLHQRPDQRRAAGRPDRPVVLLAQLRDEVGHRPLISVLFRHWSTVSRVVEATYFWMLLIQLANGSSVDVGQYSANSVNVTRPSSTASCSSSMRCNAAPISSSTPGWHSVGASTTPSIELNNPAATLRM